MAFLRFISDQTPTPTRFLKNCEEVGLFNELASPFENEFKKASEDDIKKVCSKKHFILRASTSFLSEILFKKNRKPTLVYVLPSKLCQ